MSGTVVIILGAGASHAVNLSARPGDNPAYRPPLTREIFGRSHEFESILQKFPLAQILSSEIDRRIRRSSQNLEEILRSYSDQLAKGVDDHITRQFLQIPVYLNSLFGEISTHFTRNPDQYADLVNMALSRSSRVLFLTLNYDVLLEIPLARIHGIDFSNEAQYVSDKWVLTKLHGSVNWYRRFKSPRARFATPDLLNYLEHLRTVHLPLDLDDTIHIVRMWTHGLFYIDEIPTYPALTVPVVGKYELNCPPGLLERTVDFLRKCENYLVIGTSATDRDLLELLNQHCNAGRLWVVGRSEESTQQALRNVLDAAPKLREDTSVFFHQNGFAEFVDGGRMEEFFSTLR